MIDGDDAVGGSAHVRISTNFRGPIMAVGNRDAMSKAKVGEKVDDRFG